SAASSNQSSFSMQHQQLFQTLNVNLAERSYPILIGQSVLSDRSILSQHIPGDRVAIVTNTVVAPLYLAKIEQHLRDLGKQFISIILPDG
ncbi:hypothetical protein QN347_19955, partial [Sphingomonas sp. 10B4]|nr:hypothetical protein [Sphingomonas sp. 10B4]